MVWTSGNLFIIAAGGVLGASAVGALKAAQTLMGITHILFQGLENIVPVRSAELYRRGGAHELKAYLRRVTLFLGGVTAAIGLIFSVTPGFWLGLVFGDSFVSHGDLLRWYAVIYTLGAVLLPLRAGLRTVENTRPIFLAYLASTTVAVIATYPIVQWLELTGAMVGLLFTQVLMLLILVLAVRNEIVGRD